MKRVMQSDAGINGMQSVEVMQALMACKVMQALIESKATQCVQGTVVFVALQCFVTPNG